MSTLIANGVAHHVQELGPSDALPVVMTHGLVIGSLASWYFTVGPALARTRRVRMYDLRGHGRSARMPSGYDTHTLATDLDALTRDLPPFDLVEILIAGDRDECLFDRSQDLVVGHVGLRVQAIA